MLVMQTLLKAPIASVAVIPPTICTWSEYAPVPETGVHLPPVAHVGQVASLKRTE
jgi:hypothetical protein